MRHPDWCARLHHCTAHYPSGEHASVPEVFDTRAGRIVATRYRNNAGRDRLEVRAVTRLPVGDNDAQEHARALIALTGAVLQTVAGAR